MAPRLPRGVDLAYADAFLAIMVAFIFATLLVAFMRNVAAPKAPAQAAH